MLGAVVSVNELCLYFKNALFLFFIVCEIIAITFTAKCVEPGALIEISFR